MVSVGKASVLKVLLIGVCFVFTGVSGEAAEENKMNQDKKYFMTTGLMIRKAVEVPASVDDVWEAWTTAAGVKTFFSPDASVELAVNGDYEMYFDKKQPEGLKGSEGCKVLSFVPGEMFSFTWNAPPNMPNVRKERTWVVLMFKNLGPKKTQVLFFHLGWQMGEEWQKALQYFHKAWDVVLVRLAYRFQNGPIDWKKPYTPGK
jgi:uncharacterized protein YndB with AHSA1/START domain